MIKKLIIDPTAKNSIYTLRDTISNEIFPIVKSKRTIVILCIGTDRSTGDSLGPIVGDKLKFLVRNRVALYGNLQYPVHAKNISDIITEINSKYNNPFTIAIDACLGNIQNVGKIILESKPLHPGSAMNKSLPKVGDLSITGIVNICGAMEFMVLQNTRLFTVMQLADTISKGVYHSILKTIGGKSNTSFLRNVEA
ncbi:spore protease YyaC [Clostridium kluyveri]|uniref:Spore protease YyaC n=1 Tax=Clostridium kluyveri TaxID=1534 RepID=A0A1L5FDQ2_CLOKL|nr:spore protease YyaC [Clostridium kluyveri]APM41136.1 spore protease YyaC [Clostridium kluyveri]UZQ48586.1 spore protease YyaC [Clostridium kluyveri]